MLISALIVIGAFLLLMHWHRVVQDRTQLIAAELRQSQNKCAAALAGLQDARRVRASLEKFIGKAAQVEAVCRGPDESAALAKGILNAEVANIEVREVQAARGSDVASAWSLRVLGFASGPSPEAVADSFRNKVKAELERTLTAVVTTRLEQVGTLRGAAAKPENERWVSFTIVAEIAASARPEGREG